MKNKSQSGSMHLIVIAILVLIIVGMLGFVTWRNFFQNKSTDNGLNTTDPTKIALTEIASDDVSGSGFAIKYPKSWVILENNSYYQNNKSMASFDTTITSPDSQVTVEFKGSNYGGIGGVCHPEENGTISQFAIDSITNFSDAIFNSYIIHSLDGTYKYTIGAQRKIDNTVSVEAGDSSCKYALSEFIMPNEPNIVTVQIKLNNVENSKTTTLDAVNQAMTTDNYKIAKRIIQSLYVK